MAAFVVIAWLLQGRAAFKHELAERGITLVARMRVVGCTGDSLAYDDIVSVGASSDAFWVTDGKRWLSIPKSAHVTQPERARTEVHFWAPDSPGSLSVELNVDRETRGGWRDDDVVVRQVREAEAITNWLNAQKSAALSGSVASAADR